jgi:hypothetical protein
MNEFLIPDGYTMFKHVEAVPGLFPAADVMYRPASSLERNQIALSSTAEAITRAEDAVIVKYLVSINGERWNGQGRLRPALRSMILNLILGYVGSDEERADLKNSPTA